MSILLDTNVISELVGGRKAAPQVVAWFDSVSNIPLYLSVITETELLRGVAAMPDGKRRSMLAADIDAMLEIDFAERILAYDGRAAHAFANIEAHRRRIGKPINIFDCQIAAIARVNNLPLATRDISDFENCGLKLINPWRVDHGEN